MAIISKERQAVLSLVLQYLTKGKVTMNLEQFKSIIRLVAGIASGWLIAKGIGDAAIWEVITAGVVAGGTLVWSQVTHATK